MIVRCEKCNGLTYTAQIKTFRNGSSHIEIICSTCGKHLTYAKSPLTSATTEKAEDFVFKSGKHSGKVLSEVFALDPGYITWFANEGNGLPSQMCKDYLGRV